MAGAVQLASLKAALPGLAGTSDDAQLTTELGIAESQVAQLCGWPTKDDGTRDFLAGAYTLHPGRSGARPRLLPLPFAPSVVSAVYVTLDDTYDSATLVNAADYVIDGRALWRISGGAWGVGRRANRVVCTAGWAAGAAPPSTEAAVVALAVHRWRVLRHGQGMASASQQGTSVTRDALTSVPMLVQELARASVAYSLEDEIA